MHIVLSTQFTLPIRCTKFDYVFVPITSVVDETLSNRTCTNVHIFSHCLHPHELLHVYVCNMRSLWCVDQIVGIKYCESMSYVARLTINICISMNISLHFHLLDGGIHMITNKPWTSASTTHTLYNVMWIRCEYDINMGVSNAPKQSSYCIGCTQNIYHQYYSYT